MTAYDLPEFLEKLAALTPRSEVPLLLYHGVLAPHARWRRQIVGFGRSAASQEAAPRQAERGASRCPRTWAWAALMRRAFGIDVLACPRCGARLRLVATVEDPRAVGTILTPLGLLHPGPAPPPAARPAPATSRQ
jgi:hypothetical protein